MPKKQGVAFCLALVWVLLAGCGQGVPGSDLGSSAPAVSSSAPCVSSAMPPAAAESTASSQGMDCLFPLQGPATLAKYPPEEVDERYREAYTGAEPWQQLFFSIVMKRLECENIEEISLFFQMGSPVPKLVVRYRNTFEVWEQQTGEEALRLLCEPGYGITMNKSTGEWTISTGEDDGDYRDSMLRMSQYESPAGPDVVLIPLQPLRKETLRMVFAEFFLDTYTPKVPKEAPEWVTTYLQYFNTRLWWPQKGNGAMGVGRMDGLTLYGGQRGEAPILMSYFEYSDYDGGPLYLLPGTRGQYSVYGIYGSTNGNWDTVPSLYQDGLGNYLFRSNGESYTAWYRPSSEAGWTHLFGEGMFGYDYPADIYINGECRFFETETAGERWLDTQRRQLLDKYGYGPTLTLCQGSWYPIGNEETQRYISWEAFEHYLMESLCDYAKKVGQWG